MDHVRTASDRQAASEGCYLDIAAAERVRTFAARCCPHTKGQWSGKPFNFLPWQWDDVIVPLFGWKKADGRRRFRKAYIEIPKKNGKSTICAVLALYLLCADHEPGAEVYGAGLDRQQASIVFREAMLMARKSPVLGPMLRIRESAKTIHDDRTGSLYRCLSADAGRHEGLNMSGLIFDEYHTQKNRLLSEALEYSGASRRQPLLVEITTAGSDLESVCYEEHKYAASILAGETIDTGFFPFIRAAGEEDDPDSEATWYKANPSLGVTIPLDSFRDDWQRSKRSPAAWNSFQRYRLNRWIESVSAWLDFERWKECGGEPEIPAGEPVYAGLDLSSTTDLTAFAIWHPPSGSVKWWFWAPTEAFKERERKNKTRLEPWVREKLITPIPGAMIDQGKVYEDIVQICSRYNVQAIGADPYNAVSLLMRLVSEAGLPVREYRQGMLHMSGPMKSLQGKILDGRVRHGNNPVASWMFGNVAVKTDESENIRPAKNKCADKIDGIVAWIMAEGVALSGEGPSVYERVGL